MANELSGEHTAILELCNQLDDAENATEALEVINVLSMLIKNISEKKNTNILKKCVIDFPSRRLIAF